jgi:hypothetical protein
MKPTSLPRIAARGENTMERVAKLVAMLLGIGVVAVVAGFLPRHTFAAEKATTKSLINLQANGLQSSGRSINPYFYQFDSATEQYSNTAYALPSGESLVVTDIVTTFFGCPVGTFVTNDLYASFQGVGTTALYNTLLTVTATNGFTVTDHFTSGFVFTGPNPPLAGIGTDQPCENITMTIVGAEVPGNPAVGSFQ